MRLSVARLVIASTSLLAACTTTLSYRYDAGAGDGGPLPDGGSPDGVTADAAALETGIPADGAFPGCPGTAQFCDNFDTFTKWGEIDVWHTQDRSGSPPNAFATNTVDRAGGKALRLLGKSKPGGHVKPLRTFKRSGPEKTLTISFAIQFPTQRHHTFVEIVNAGNPNGGRIAINLLEARVDTTPAVTDYPNDGAFHDVRITITGDSFNTVARFDVIGGSSGSATFAASLGTDLEVFFGVMNEPSDNSFPI